MRASVFCASALFGEALGCLLRHAGGFVVTHRDLRLDRLTNGSMDASDAIIVTDDLLTEEGLAMLDRFRNASGARVVLVTERQIDFDADAVVRPSLGATDLFATLRTLEPPDSPNALVGGDSKPKRDSRGQKVRLSPRETDVARLLTKGLSNRRIAETLGVQEQSVKNCVSSLMQKLGCENRVQVLLRIQSSRVLEDD